VRRRLEDIRTAGLRASGLTEQMLAYSGKGRFVVEPLDLNVLITELSELLQVSISKRCVLRYDLAQGLPSIEADSAQIRQVVMNLITNASEAIGDQDGRISIATRVIEASGAELLGVPRSEPLAPGRYVLLEVADTGCGMDEATKDRIFDPFFTTKTQGGTGLGLAISKRIIQEAGGTISVASDPGEWTRFTVRLPWAGQGEPDPRPRS
jgi:two-component system cell cycle sensor histidine kinase/response regulator CckA